MFLKFLCPLIKFAILGEWFGFHSCLVVGGIGEELIMQSRLFEDGISILNGEWGSFRVNVQPKTGFNPAMKGWHLVLDEWFNCNVVPRSLFQAFKGGFNVLLSDLEALRELLMNGFFARLLAASSFRTPQT